MEQFAEDGRLITAAFVNTFIQKRKRELHKGSCGKVLIVAGSRGMAGAAALCAGAALRGGAGLVRVSIDEELFPIVQTVVPEATCVPRRLLPEGLEEYQAAVIGPGLGATAENERMIRTVLERFRGTVVLDADGLNLLAAAKFPLPGDRLVLTPHPGEAGRLLGRTAAEVNADRPGAVRRLAEMRQAVAVLKGAGTLVAVPGGPTYINTTGNPGMATGGSGDVLAGLIGALAGQGLPPWAAAVCGVWIHGMAGDKMAARLGEYSLVASDVIRGLAPAFLELERERERGCRDALARGYEEMGPLNLALAEEALEAGNADLEEYEKTIVECDSDDG
ncbi:MAG: NAD(P)H-hydrate dehydratase [Bacillota bacterium]|nr:NAD(P)H-hydrate dehydratase [Bacillota bacterium]